MKTRQNLLSVIALLFIVSGAAGLMYQIVWFKYLSLFLGNTTYAQTIVLASFMGGIAIGAALWGRRADASKSPLALYAWLEIGIGVYCLAYPWILGYVKSLFISVVIGAGLASDSEMVLFLKLLVSLVTLLPPTILMGGTLPVLVRFLSTRIEESGKNVAILYFLNSFGAVVGSLLGGFFFIPMIGLLATIFTAVGVNIVVGVVALLLSRMKFEQVEQKAETVVQPEQSYNDRQIRIAILIAGGSGFAAMVYEVAWVRLLMPLFGSTTYSFTLMLVAFISGITLGSWIVSTVISRIKNLFGFLAVCQLGVVLSMIVTLPLYGRLPYYLWNIGSLLSRTEGAYYFFVVLQFSICFVVMFVPTIFLGMSLPVASRIVIRRIEMLGASVGNIFSVNTLGTVLGSLTAGLLLIPTIGIRHALEVGIAVNLALGFLVLWGDTATLRVRKMVFASTSAALFLVYMLTATGWNQTVMLMSIFRQIAFNAPPAASFAEFELEASKKKILYYKEGASATVAVAQIPMQVGSSNSLYINGKVDASSVGDLPTQVLLGQIPMLLQTTQDDVLVIGLGSGVTAGSILTHPVLSVDCVEISPEVVEASKFFEDVNNRPFDDPRLRMVVDDALAYLKLTTKKYDTIVSEPSNPWVAGIGNLFSREFFLQCKTRLKENGLLVQWFHTYDMSDETFRLVIRTLRELFPYVMMWQSLDKDMILCASEKPLPLEYASLKAKFEIAGVRQDLERIGIPDAMTFLSQQMASEESVARYAGVGEVNTEDLPLLEYLAPHDLFLHRFTIQLGAFDERTTFGGATLFFKTAIQEHGMTDQEMFHIGKLHIQPFRGNPALGYQMLLNYAQKNPNDLLVLQYLVQAADLFNRDEEALRYLKHITQISPSDPEVLSTYAWRKYNSEREVATTVTPFDFSEQEKLMERSIELVGDTVDQYRVQLGEMYFRAQRYEEAVPHYEKALKLRETHPGGSDMRDDQLLLRLAQSYRHLDNRSKALQYGVQATMVNPRNETARDLVYEIWSTITK
ncbi:MAG TPA: fused MFS/spermidine synthase [Bacteroidota bacterium]